MRNMALRFADTQVVDKLPDFEISKYPPLFKNLKYPLFVSECKAHSSPLCALSRDSSVDIVTGLQAGHPWNCGSILDRDKRFVSSPEVPELL